MAPFIWTPEFGYPLPIYTPGLRGVMKQECFVGRYPTAESVKPPILLLARMVDVRRDANEVRLTKRQGRADHEVHA